MGHSSDLQIELMEARDHEKKIEWIDENYGEVEEGTVGWYKAEEKYYENQFDDYSSHNSDDDKRLNSDSDNYFVKNKSRYDLFLEAIKHSNLLNTIYSNEPGADQNLKIMLYGHVVAATEGYLFFTFIDSVMSSETLLQSLIESDPEFEKRKFALKDFFRTQRSIKTYVKEYLQGLIFHRLSKVKVMYKNVLGCEFGDIEFLYEAVVKRHDCVHRAGYDKDGHMVDISKEDVETLLNACGKLANSIKTHLDSTGTDPK